jgi:hypothetical protein
MWLFGAWRVLDTWIQLCRENDRFVPLVTDMSFFLTKEWGKAFAPLSKKKIIYFLGKSK